MTSTRSRIIKAMRMLRSCIDSGMVVASSHTKEHPYEVVTRLNEVSLAASRRLVENFHRGNQAG